MLDDELAESILAMKEIKGKEFVKLAVMIPREIFDLLLDLASHYGSIDSAISRSIKRMHEEVFKLPKKSIRKVMTVEEALKRDILNELKGIIRNLERRIKEVNREIQRVQKVSAMVSPITSKEIMQHDRKIEHKIEMPDLIVAGEQKIIAPLETRKKIEDAIEDVLVVAIAEDLLKEEDSNKE
ncbi:MAG: hypothetical protein ACP6IQ_09550 [Candidatus Njordarchaeia archaeon]|nr:hypothetical protein [Candidatus Korarchaeota archaeon]